MYSSWFSLYCFGSFIYCFCLAFCHAFSHVYYAFLLTCFLIYNGTFRLETCCSFLGFPSLSAYWLSAASSICTSNVTLTRLIVFLPLSLLLAWQLLLLLWFLLFLQVAGDTAAVVVPAPVHVSWLCLIHPDPPISFQVLISLTSNGYVFYGRRKRQPREGL